jgi:hypothetical protein
MSEQIFIISQVFKRRFTFFIFAELPNSHGSLAVQLYLWAGLLLNYQFLDYQ